MPGILDQSPEGGVYLGDGVYCKFDGFQLWLTVGHHQNTPLVALEPSVFAELLRVARQINQFAGQEHFLGAGFEGVRQS